MVCVDPCDMGLMVSVYGEGGIYVYTCLHVEVTGAMKSRYYK
jgi:hypothetical protein